MANCLFCGKPLNKNGHPKTSNACTVIGGNEKDMSQLFGPPPTSKTSSKPPFMDMTRRFPEDRKR